MSAILKLTRRWQVKKHFLKKRGHLVIAVVILVLAIALISIYFNKIFASTDAGTISFDFNPISTNYYMSLKNGKYAKPDFYSKITFEDGMAYPLNNYYYTPVYSFKFKLDCGNGTIINQPDVTFPRSGTYFLKFSGCQYATSGYYSPYLIVDQLKDGVANIGYTAKTDIHIIDDPNNYWLDYNNCNLSPVAKSVTPTGAEIAEFGRQVVALDYYLSGYQSYLLNGSAIHLAYSLTENSHSGSGGYLQLHAKVTNRTSSSITLDKVLAEWQERLKPVDVNLISSSTTLAVGESKTATATIYPTGPMENYNYTYLVRFLIGYNFPNAVSDWICQAKPIDLGNIIPTPLSPTPTPTPIPTKTATIPVYQPTPQPSPTNQFYMYKGFNIIGVTEDFTTDVFAKNGMTFYALNSAMRRWDVTTSGSVNMKANVAYYVYSPDTRWIAGLPFVNYYNLSKPVVPHWNLIWTVGEPSAKDVLINLHDSSGKCLAQKVPLDYLKQSGAIYRYVYLIKDSHAVAACDAFALLSDQEKTANCTNGQTNLAETSKIPAYSGIWIYFFEDKFKQSDFAKYPCSNPYL